MENYLRREGGLPEAALPPLGRPPFIAPLRAPGLPLEWLPGLPFPLVAGLPADTAPLPPDLPAAAPFALGSLRALLPAPAPEEARFAAVFLFCVLLLPPL